MITILVAFSSYSTYSIQQILKKNKNILRQQFRNISSKWILSFVITTSSTLYKHPFFFFCSGTVKPFTHWPFLDHGCLVLASQCSCLCNLKSAAFVKGSLHCDASVLVCSAESTVASEVHWYRVDKRSAARCEHAVQAHLITGALTFYYKYLPPSSSPPFSCPCLSLCLHLLLCHTIRLLLFAFPFVFFLLSSAVLMCLLVLICLLDSHATLFPPLSLSESYFLSFPTITVVYVSKIWINWKSSFKVLNFKPYFHKAVISVSSSERWYKAMWIFPIQRTFELLDFLGEPCFRWFISLFHCSTKLSVWAGVALYYWARVRTSPTTTNVCVLTKHINI